MSQATTYYKHRTRQVRIESKDGQDSLDLAFVGSYPLLVEWVDSSKDEVIQAGRLLLIQVVEHYCLVEGDWNVI